jgi:hypothetical protein
MAISGGRQRLQALLANRRPELIATAVAAVLAIAYLLAPLMGDDLSAQLARADFAAYHPYAPLDLRWFGGTLPFGYSLWVPQVMAVIGTRLLGAIAVVVATWLVTRLMRCVAAARPTAGGVAAAFCQASNLVEGRIAFAVGATCGLAALLAIVGIARFRRPAAAIAALLAAAASPVAALLLWLCAAAALARRRYIDAAVIVVASAIPVVVISGVFADGGRQLYDPVDALRAALATALAAVLIPRRYQALRIGAGLGVVMVVAAYALPTPVGGNASRLSLLFAVPVVAAFVPWRWWLASLAVLAVVIVQTPVTFGTLTSAGGADTEASYYAPLLNEISAQGQLTGRVEVPELNGHWEAYFVARAVPLARGWLRQVDTELNDDVFYKHKPTTASYQGFLSDNAVEYVAVPDARLTYYGKREAKLINGGLSYLKPIWKSSQWTLYQVQHAVPIVEAPGKLVNEGADSITFTAPPNTAVRINVRNFRWLSASSGSCLKRDGSTVLFETGPAQTSYVLSSALDPNNTC